MKFLFNKRNLNLKVVAVLLFCYILSYALLRAGKAIVRNRGRSGSYVVYHIRGIRYVYSPLWIIERKSRTFYRIVDRKLKRKRKIDDGKLLVVQKKPSQLRKIDRLFLSNLTCQSLPMISNTDSLVFTFGTPDTMFDRETARMSPENVSSLQRTTEYELTKDVNDSSLYAVSDFISKEITYQHYIYNLGKGSSLTFAVYEKRAQIMEIIFHENDSLTLYLQDTIPLSGRFTYTEAQKLFATTLVNVTTDTTKQKLLLFKTNSNNGSAVYETPMLYFQDQKLVRFFNYPQL